MTVAIILAVIVAIAAIAYLMTRSRAPSETLGAGEETKGALPKPAEPVAKPAPSNKPKTQPAEPAKPARPAAAEPSEAKPAAATPAAVRPAKPTAIGYAPVDAVPGGRPAALEPVAVAEEPEAVAVVSEPVIEAGAPEPVAAPAPTAPSVRPPPPPSVRPPVAVQKEHKDTTALRKGLQQTRGGWVQKLVGLFGGKKQLDPELVQEIEETLILGDVGVKTTQSLLDALKERLGREDMSSEAVWSTLREVGRGVLDVPAPAFGANTGGKPPLVILVVGVNGVGKTTTIGKLAARYKEQGKKVYLAAGDTFRAAAVAQLEAWGKRVGVPVVKGKDLTKPGAVVFEAVQKGAAEGADVIIADTAGRLHTKTPLMDELRKLRDAAVKALPGAPHEILLVLDATTGQNGLTQVREFRDALPLTGIVLTKLDGTAKGGIILGICDEFKLPVRFIGVGEKVDDLREFDAEEFTQVLFSSTGDDDSAAA